MTRTKKTPGKEKSTKTDKHGLKGFEISINSFGEIQSSIEVDKINEFLDKNLEDRKLKGAGGKSGQSRKKKLK